MTETILTNAELVLGDRVARGTLVIRARSFRVRRILAVTS
jgi:hypothetical protein